MMREGKMVQANGFNFKLCQLFAMLDVGGFLVYEVKAIQFHKITTKEYSQRPLQRIITHCTSYYERV